ncbi:MAG TPA: VWA domain-containing protein [Acidobacteriaceae bacterium]|nr:VWA domain-containing protein [Acidobacteriaceae bacterium]
MFISRWLYVAALFLPALAAGAGTTPVPAQPSGSTPVPITSPNAEGLIHLDVVVTDSGGRPVAGLSRNHFSVVDASQPEPILSFGAFAASQGSLQSSPPTSVIVLLDTVDVPSAIAAFEQQQLEQFLRQNGGHLAQPISLLALNDSGLWEVSAPSSDGAALADALARRHYRQMLRPLVYGPPGAATAWQQHAPADRFSNAALENLGAIATAERRVSGRKMLLWIGPRWGIGTGKSPIINDAQTRQKSFDALVWFSTLLRDAHITLYSFSAGPLAPVGTAAAQIEPSDLRAWLRISSPREMSDNALNRNVLAIASGGRALPPGMNLAEQIEGCLREANAFYVLSFNPAPARERNEYHDVQIRIDLPGLTAQTATGYYDQPYYSDQPDPALRGLTVEELHQILETARGMSDSGLAHRLQHLSLTERLSTSKLDEWLPQLPGKKSREALTVQADLSAILAPPPADIPADLPPDSNAQQQMIARATDYLTHTMGRLPNFYARRAAALYVNTPPAYDGSVQISAAEPIHLINDSNGTVLYRNGSEVVDAKKSRHSRESGTLSTYGTFGPVLNAVLDNIARHNLAWSRWESRAGGRRAVFRFTVPLSQSHYVIAACCLPDGDGRTMFARAVGYRGEIAIDPQTGAILRVMISGDLAGIVPLDRSEIVVSYGPVSIGGRTYICPLHSVSFMHSRNVDNWQLWDESFRTWGPWMSMLNDFSFSNYHLFRANVRMLSGYTPLSDSSPTGQPAPQ